MYALTLQDCHYDKLNLIKKEGCLSSMDDYDDVARELERAGLIAEGVGEEDCPIRLWKLTRSGLDILEGMKDEALERALEATKAFASAVQESVAEHHDAGRAVVVEREGQLVRLEPPTKKE